MFVYGGSATNGFALNDTTIFTFSLEDGWRVQTFIRSDSSQHLE